MTVGEQTSRALVIEDQDLMRLALISELKAALRDCIVQGAATWEIASGLLREHSFDLVIIDPGLPGFDPTSPQHRLAVVKAVVDASPDALHIVVTGSDSVTAPSSTSRSRRSARTSTRRWPTCSGSPTATCSRWRR